MRFTTTALISLACACAGGARATSAPGGSKASDDVAEFSALAFVPNQPTYLVTAHTVREAQRGVSDAVDAFGMVAGVSSRDAGKELERVLGFDPLSEAGLARIGVDPAGAIAIFAEDPSPTLVVKLASPEAAQSYFSDIRNRMATTSVIVDGIEVVSAPFLYGTTASWATDKNWLWIHVGAKGTDPGAAWFAHSHHATGSAWTSGLGWARHVRAKLGAKAGLLGFLDTKASLALARAASPDLDACLARFVPIGLAGFAIDGDGKRVGGSLAFDLGPAAQRIAAATLPPPPGFAGLAAKAPIAVQWNLDLGAVASFLEPCMKLAGGSPDELTKYGVRTARIAVQTLDLGDKSGTGVIAADLSAKSFVASYLDQIPQRSLFESDRTYGGYHGKHISVPFVAKLDYVLDDQRAFVAMGDGMMDRLVGGAGGPVPVFALDLIPSGFSESVWTFVIGAMTNEWFAKRASSALQSWQAAHLRVTIDREALVIDASGNRR